MESTESYSENLVSTSIEREMCNIITGQCEITSNASANQNTLDRQLTNEQLGISNTTTSNNKVVTSPERRESSTDTSNCLNTSRDNSEEKSHGSNITNVTNQNEKAEDKASHITEAQLAPLHAHNDTERTILVTNALKPQPMAFTIDFSGNNKTENLQKYKSMLEKMQNRHKRGQSLSKLEESQCSNSQATVSKTPATVKLPRKFTKTFYEGKDNYKLPLQQKYGSLSTSISFHDSPSCFERTSKLRHSLGSKSLSPRTSWHDNSSLDFDQYLLSLPEQHNSSTLPIAEIKSRESGSQISTAIKGAVFDKVIVQSSVADYGGMRGITPRDEDTSSTVSEAGTYTIENDNYTEEQKARMNIDEAFDVGVSELENVSYTECFSNDFNEPTHTYFNESNELENTVIEKSEFIQYVEPISHKLENLDMEARGNLLEKNILNEELKTSRVSTDKNVLEVSYCYEPNVIPKSKTHKSVLEKLKNRVKNISERTFQKAKSPEKSVDVGNFTSVTTSGILSTSNEFKNYAKIDSVDVNKKILHCKNSLTKSHVDTSDYLEPIVSQCYDAESDDEKVKILNISHHKSQISPNSSIRRPVISPTQIKRIEKIIQPNRNEFNEKANKQSFQNNWIYEWAKCASEHNRKQQKYDTISDAEKLTNKQLNMSASYSENDAKRLIREMSLPVASIEPITKTNNVKLPPRHPSASPTKIPSPISTLARPRSRNSFSLSGSIPDLNSSNTETESYLRNTEDAINSLQNIKGNRAASSVLPSSRRSVSRTSSSRHSLESPLSPKRSPQHTVYTQISPTTTEQLSPKHINFNRYDSRQFKCESSPTSPKYFVDNQIKSPTFVRSRARHTRHFSFDNSNVDNDKINNLEIYDKRIPYHHAHNLQMNYEYKNDDTNHHLVLDKINIKQHNRHHSFDTRNFNKEERYTEKQLEYLPHRSNRHYVANKSDVAETSSYGIDQTSNLRNNRAFVQRDVCKGNKSDYTPFNKNITNNEFVTINNKLLPKHQNSPNSSPIKRSSSFSTAKNFSNDVCNSMKPKPTNYGTPKLSNKQIQRSASNASVMKFMNVSTRRSSYNSDSSKNDYDEEYEYGDSKHESEFDIYSSDSDNEKNVDTKTNTEKLRELIKNTRANRAFSLRRARLETDNTEPIKLIKSASSSKINQRIKSAEYRNLTKPSICPNTPEVSRRNVKERASMPRDTSLNRMKQNLGDTNTDLKSPTAPTKKVQPRYLDISKYKSSTTGNFLRKDESKSYVDTKSATAANKKQHTQYVSLNRNDAGRLSSRSNKFPGAKNDIGNKPTISKEQELANWKRRATYDPMKAAAEGRKKAEFAKKKTNQNVMTHSFDENEDMT